MRSLLIALSIALAAAPALAANSNVVGQATNIPVAASSPATLEKEFQQLMADDDAAKKEAQKWMDDNDSFAASGGGVPEAELNRRIRERFEPVRKGYRDFLEQHPDYVRARVAYGSLLRDLNDEPGAQEQWERALTIETNDPAIYDDLATIYGEHGPKQKAFEYFEKALQLNPREPLYYHNLGDVVYVFRKDAQEFYHLNEEQVFAKAFQLYSNALRLDPDNFPYASDIAMSYYALRPLRVEAALQAWTNALNIAADEIDRQGVFLHFARINLVAGRFEEAHRHLDKVTDQHYADLKARLTHNLEQQEAEAKGTNAPPAAIKRTVEIPAVTNGPTGH